MFDSHPLPQATQALLCRVPITTPSEFDAAVQSAKEAFPKWRDTAMPTRARVMFKFQELIRANMVRIIAQVLPSCKGMTHRCRSEEHCHHMLLANGEIIWASILCSVMSRNFQERAGARKMTKIRLCQYLDRNATVGRSCKHQSFFSMWI